jgi:hypothetical protein
MPKIEKKSAQDRPRKAYHSPKLVDYGSLARLIKGGATSVVSDHGANMMYP